MDAKLVVAKGKTAVKEIPLNGPETIIGRRNDCTLRIPSPLVSRQHCTLMQDGTRLLVKDLGSSNGTFVNGARVKQKVLRSGDTLGVGPVTFIVQLVGSATSPGDTSRPGVAAAAVVGDDAADFVVEAEAAEDPAEFVVEAQPTSADADFVVDEVDATVAENGDVDYVVGAEATEAGGGELDFVVADEAPAGSGGADFVVAEEAGDPATVHDVPIADIMDDDAPTRIREPDTQIFNDPADLATMDAEVVEAEAELAAEPAQPKKKGGLFGKFFRKKDKSAKAEPDKRSAKKAETPKAAAPPPSKGAPKKHPAAPPPAHAALPAADESASEFHAHDDAQGTAKPPGEDELADFLMNLNEKDQ